MAGGLVLWIALRRNEAGKPGLNPFLGLLSGVGGILALVGVVFPFSDISYLLGLGGLGLAASALLIGFLAMAFAPAYPRPVERRWESDAPAPTEPHQLVNEHVPEPQDLTRIEGIGPKIQEILYQAGISTYADLAAHEPEEIGSIVKAAGFGAPFDPATWPEQAELAAKGDWDALQNLQDELSGGRASG
jgi:predicted flap endonuclease-1-like 5' DNA nuclease